MDGFIRSRICSVGCKQEGNTMKYLKLLMKERTTWDGAVLIAICGSVILFGGLAKMMAWVGLGYGIWTLLKKED
jgi:hypothetical protein